VGDWCSLTQRAQYPYMYSYPPMTSAYTDPSTVSTPAVATTEPAAKRAMHSEDQNVCALLLPTLATPQVYVITLRDLSMQPAPGPQLANDTDVYQELPSPPPEPEVEPMRHDLVPASVRAAGIIRSSNSSSSSSTSNTCDETSSSDGDRSSY
jgi:hypothetical protein